jgi:hypothetical protein
MASEPPSKEPWSEEKKDRLLGYLRTELERDEHDKTQVCEPTPPKISEERRLQDLRYLREVLEEEERRNSQVIPIE